MGDKKRRLEKLEKAGGGDDEINVSVNWCEPGFVIDKDTGEEVTTEEWKKRHPDVKLIVVQWEDEDEHETN